MKFRLPILSFLTFFLSSSSAFAQQVPTVYVPPPPNVPKDLGKIISASFQALLLIAGFLAFFYMVIGGIQWITSGGDKAGLEAARNKIIHAIIGLIVVFSSWALMLLVQSFIGGGAIGGSTTIQPIY